MGQLHTHNSHHRTILGPWVSCTHIHTQQPPQNHPGAHGSAALTHTHRDTHNTVTTATTEPVGPWISWTRTHTETTMQFNTAPWYLYGAHSQHRSHAGTDDSEHGCDFDKSKSQTRWRNNHYPQLITAKHHSRKLPWGPEAPQNEKDENDLKKEFGTWPFFPIWTKMEKQGPCSKPIWDQLGPFRNE